MRKALLFSFSLLLASSLLVWYREYSKEWKVWQRRGNELLKALGKREKPIEVIFVNTRWGKEELCLTCHRGIKSISRSHPTEVFGCTVCHGGDPLSLTVKGAHKRLRGGKNPSDFRFVELSCGEAPDGTPCHSGNSDPLKNHITRIKGSVMGHMAGAISDLLYQWNARETAEPVYASTYSIGRLKKLPDVNLEKDGINNLTLSIDHFRKLCVRCHAGVETRSGKSSHASGCAACHAIYNDRGTYDGLDPTIPRDEFGHPRFHMLTVEIPSSQCLHCHNRSGREGTSYVGIMESDFYGTPYVRGRLSPNRLMGGRFYHNMLPDVHYERGMECIDCHTGLEIMGDGKVYGKMYEQLEVRCEDCHGDHEKEPKIKALKRGDYALYASIFNPNYSLKESDLVLTSSKGKFIPNVKMENGKLYLYSKLSGKRFEIKTVTGDKNHRAPCQGRLECHSCHASWEPLCYGCHDVLYMRGRREDGITKVKKPGFWREARSYTRFEGIVLGVNERGKVSPLEFCQTQVTVVGKNGKVVDGYDNKVFWHKDGLPSYVVAAIDPHTTRKEAKRCVDCHMNPLAMGLGVGFYENGTFKTIYRSRASGLNVGFSPETVVKDGVQVQSVSNPGVRGLSRDEIRRMIEARACIICHPSYKDKAYERPGSRCTYFSNN